MTKKEWLFQLRNNAQYRICSPADFSRLANHLAQNAEYRFLKKEDIEIRTIFHNGHYYIPCEDDRLRNCDYKPRRA